MFSLMKILTGAVTNLAGGGGTWRGGAHFLRIPQPVQKKEVHFDTLFRNY